MRKFFSKFGRRKLPPKWRWALRIGLVLLIAFGIWFDIDLWRISSSALSNQLPATPADAIIVLGCGPEIPNKPSDCQIGRTSAGVSLWKAGYASDIILTGGNTGRGTEADLLAVVARGQGVPDDRLVLERESRNTMENLRNSRELMQQRGWHNIILVSDPFHLYRAREQAQDQGLNVVGWWPATATPDWLRFRERTQGLVRDSLALMAYESLGWWIYS